MRPGVCAQTKDFGPLPLALLLGGGDFLIALLQIHPALHGRIQRRLRFLLLGHQLGHPGVIGAVCLQLLA